MRGPAKGKAAKPLPGRLLYLVTVGALANPAV